MAFAKQQTHRWFINWFECINSDFLNTTPVWLFTLHSNKWIGVTFAWKIAWKESCVLHRWYSYQLWPPHWTPKACSSRATSANAPLKWDVTDKAHQNMSRTLALYMCCVFAPSQWSWGMGVLELPFVRLSVPMVLDYPQVHKWLLGLAMSSWNPPISHVAIKYCPRTTIFETRAPRATCTHFFTYKLVCFIGVFAFCIAWWKSK